MSKIISTIIIIVLCLTDLSALTMNGKITKQGTNEVLRNVKVELVGFAKATFTDQRGEYSLDGESAGRYKLVLYCPGYVPKISDIEINENTIRNFSLEADPLLRYEIVVTGTKTNHTVGDMPVSMEVLTTEEIRELNIRETKDLFDGMSGVYVGKNAGSYGNKANITIQGMDAKHTLILVDGQKYYGGHGSVDVASIPVNMIEKVEVVKGPSSALYGSDAMGGVVNFITKKPFQRKSQLNLSTSFGSEKLRLFEGNGNLNLGNFGSSFTISQKDSDGVNANTDKMATTNIAGFLSYKFSDLLSLSINPRYEYTNLKMQGRKQTRVILNSNLDWKDNKGTFAKLRTSFFSYHHYTINNESGGRSDWEDDTYEVEFFVNTPIVKNNLFTVGYQMRHENIDDVKKDYIASQTMHSFYAQDEISLGHLVMVLGTRVDKHDLWGTIFNPKANFKLSITDNLKLRASVGRSFRQPKLVKLYGSWNMGYFLVKPNIDLKPETSVGAQGGLEWAISNRLNLIGSYFYNDVKNLVSHHFDRSRRPWILSWINVAKAISKGIDLNLKVIPVDNLKLNLGTTFLNTENKETGKTLYDRPNFRGFAGINYNIKSISLNINIMSHIVGKRTIQKRVGRKYIDEVLDQYLVLDLAVSKKIYSFTRLYFRISNLLNTKEIYDEYNITGTRIIAGIDCNL